VIKIFENLDINDLENEIWKDILDYEGDYQVSNIGRVKSLKFGKERILKQSKDNTGYFQVCLCKNGISKPKKVHRLVFETFKEKLKDGYDAHHINEDKEDNFVDNLESKPHSDHSRDHNKGKKHSYESKKKMSENHIDYKGENNPNFGKGITNQKIIEINTDIEKGELTQKEMTKKHEVSQSTIYKIKYKKLR
jgi:hypothetical protein